MDAEPGLVDAAVAGDRDAFDALVQRYQLPILNLARTLLPGSSDVEDVTQEVFVRAWRSLKGFRGDSPFKSWLYRIAVNVVISHQRRLARERRVFRTPIAPDRVCDADQMASAADDVLLRMAIDQAMAQIPCENREAVVLRDVHGLGYREIAHALSVPIGTVESRIFRARQRLRTLLRPALCVAALLLLPAAARAQCRIEGTVVSDVGAPIADATIRVTGPDLKTPLSSQTDRDGHYVFENVKAGLRVKIEVSTGGRPVAVEYALVASYVETVNIKAEPDAATPATADDLNPFGGAAGEVRGVVRSTDGSPVAGARVFVADTAIGTATDSAGRYTFGKVRAGLTLELRASAGGFDTATGKASVPSGGSADADFTLERARTAGDRGAALGLADVAAGQMSIGLRPEDVAGVPGPARRDVFRAAQFLPSVSAVSGSESELYVRGGTPDQTAMTYDGFSWYPFSRLFGGLGAFNAESIETGRLAAGLFDAADGGALSGALGLNSRSAAGGKPVGGVDLSAFGLAGSVSLPMGDRGSLTLAGRRSAPGSLYGDVLGAFGGGTGQAVRDRVPRSSSGTFQARPDPGFYDVNAKLDLMPGRNNRVSLSVYDARDEENFSRDQSLPASSTGIAVPVAFQLPSDALVEVGDAQSWKGRGMSALWQRHWSPGVTTTATVARSRFSKTHDQGFYLTAPSTGEDYALAAGREDSSGLTEQNTLEDTTVKVAASIRAGFRHALDVGAEVVSLDADYAASTEAARPTSADSRGAPALVPLAQEANTGRTVTLFAQDVWRPAGQLVVTPGFRLTRYDLTGDTYADPRVSASYPVAPRVQLTAGWAIDHQFANRVTREDREHGDGDFWVLADGSAIPVPRAQQVTGGVTFDAPGVLFDAHLYYKRLDDLTMFASRTLPGDAPSAATTSFHAGSGTAAGLELLVQQRSDRNGLWVSYALGRAEYTYPTLEAATFPASADLRHQFKVVDSLPLRRGWSAGAAWVAAQGRPVTPLQEVRQVWFPSGDVAYQAVFGAKNSDRLAPYHRLDLSTQIDHRFRAMTATLGLTVFNVYNRDNLLFYDYETVGATSSVSSVSAMRRAVNVFFRVGF